MNLIKSPLSALLNQAGVPTLAKGGQPPAVQKPIAPSSYQVVKYSAPNNTLPQFIKYGSDPFAYLQGDNMIDAYRANPKNKFGAKDYIETQPTRLNAAQITAYMNALRDAQHLGVKPLSAEQLATMALLEGRSDFGYNQLNENNKKAVYKADLLQEMGHNRMPAEFAAALYDKQQLANRINRPLPEVWNGLGRSSLTGRTGAQHNARFNQFGYAVDSPKNAELMNTINEAYNYRPPVKQELGANEYANPMGDYVPTVEQNKPGAWFSTGGSVAPKSFYDMSKILIQKHLSGK